MVACIYHMALSSRRVYPKERTYDSFVDSFEIRLLGGRILRRLIGICIHLRSRPSYPFVNPVIVGPVTFDILLRSAQCPEKCLVPVDIF
jgi:hypothetical protein